MPELPEVETIRRELDRQLAGQKIRQVEVRLPKIIRGSVAVFRKKVPGARIVHIARRAKLVVIRLSNQQSIVVHLKMTGQLVYQYHRILKVGGHPIKEGTKDLPNKYSHVIFAFANGGHLYFNDQRQFGYMQLIATDQLEKFFQRQGYGPEPLEPGFTLPLFNELITNKSTKIKPLLMDQTFVAGIGNIYATEACWFARILPTRPAKSLNMAEVKKLYQGIRLILSDAIKKKGASADTYVDAYGEPGKYVPYLKVYGRAGELCPRCKVTIKNTVLAGRGTTYCPHCQR